MFDRVDWKIIAMVITFPACAFCPLLVWHSLRLRLRRLPSQPNSPVRRHRKLCSNAV